MDDGQDVASGAALYSLFSVFTERSVSIQYVQTVCELSNSISALSAAEWSISVWRKQHGGHVWECQMNHTHGAMPSDPL